ncbi:MAG: TrmO family methyltransferase, partial [Anaerolineales bacterium]
PQVGIFAQRGKNRPNRIGSTIVRIMKREGRQLHVKGLDAIDGTPILDIKPAMKEFLPREEIKQPEWASELMKNYWEKQ